MTTAHTVLADLVGLLRVDDRDPRPELEALLPVADQVLADSDTEPEPAAITCRRCGQKLPLADFSMTGQGRRKTCRACHAATIKAGMAKAAAQRARARRLDAPTGRPVETHGPKFPSNGGR